MTEPARRFPRDLRQPEDGFRFAVDSLLLAAFARPRRGDVVVDLGAGCGVVGLGVLLRHPELGLTLTAVEREPEMAACARANMESLGFSGPGVVLEADVREIFGPEAPAAGSAGLVVCNPPFRRPGHGRQPEQGARRRARFESDTTLGDFAAAAARLLATRGRAAFVHLAEDMPRLFDELVRAGLEPKRLRTVHGRMDDPARLALVEAVRGGRPGLVVESPLILYENDQGGGGNRPTESALAFCPFLNREEGRCRNRKTT